MNRLVFLCRFCITGANIAATRIARRYALRFTISVIGLLMMSWPAIAAEKLETAVIQNSSAYGPAALFDIYKDHLGRTVTENTAKSIAESMQQKYLADGFSRPGYKISDRGLLTGIVRIQITEAHLSKVEFSGDQGPYQQRLESIFGYLPSGNSLRPEEIRDAVRRARRLPGLDVSVSTRADTELSGGIVLEVDSTYKLVEGSVKLSNRGTEEIGRNLLFAKVVANGLLGRENTSGLFVTSAEDRETYSGVGVFANTPVGSRDTAALFQASVTSLQIETEGVLLDQDRERYLLKLTHPVLRRPDFEVSVWGGLDYDNLDVLQDGAMSREDRLRSIESGLAVQWRNKHNLTLLTFDLEQGLNGLGSRLDNFLDPDDPRQRDFTIARLRYVRLSKLSEFWSLRWDGFAQSSAQVVPSIKRFKVGGNRIGRGFEAAAISGDSGIGAKAELKRRLSNSLSWLGSTDLYGFYDVGTAWRNDLSDRGSASSTGFGLASSGSRLTGYLELAKPLRHTDADGRKDASIFVEVSLRF